MHIHFEPHDFGTERSYSDLLNVTPPNSIKSNRALPFKFDSGGKFAVPEYLWPHEANFSDNQSPSYLGTYKYYYNQSDRVIEGLPYIFENPKAVLKDTFLIVSGGSHGADEALRFVSWLDRKYHKETEVLMIGDAIEQPGPFPVLTYFSRPKRTLGINLYQRESFLAGSSIPGFENIKVIGFEHEITADFGEKLADILISRSAIRNRRIHFFGVEIQGEVNALDHFVSKYFSNDPSTREAVSTIMTDKQNATIATRLDSLAKLMPADLISAALGSESEAVRRLALHRIQLLDERDRRPYIESLISDGKPLAAFFATPSTEGSRLSSIEIKNIFQSIEVLSKKPWASRQLLDDLETETSMLTHLKKRLAISGMEGMSLVNEEIENNPLAFKGYEYALSEFFPILLELSPAEQFKYQSCIRRFLTLMQAERFSSIWKIGNRPDRIPWYLKHLDDGIEKYKKYALENP